MYVHHTLRHTYTHDIVQRTTPPTRHWVTWQSMLLDIKHKGLSNSRDFTTPRPSPHRSDIFKDPLAAGAERITGHITITEMIYSTPRQPKAKR
jgi:hypothetical protein